MNVMRLQDGPGWSPDGGKFWVKGDTLYWSDGDVWDMRDGGVICTMPGGYQHDEDYSVWPDAKREAVLAESKARYAAHAEQERLRGEARDRLRRSAREKLTHEEIEACDLLG